MSDLLDLLRCLLFGHDPGAVPVVRGDRLSVKCLRCHRISKGVPIVVRTKDRAPAVYESRQVLRLVVKKRA